MHICENRTLAIMLGPNGNCGTVESSALELGSHFVRVKRRAFSKISLISTAFGRVAVLAVLFFHTGFKAFRRGYVGVDIFYVISGYLITSLLAEDLRNERFSLISFYERRMRRIFPALFTVLFICIVASSILLDPAEMVGFGKSLLTTTFFFSNFYFWHSAEPAGYFDTVNTPPLRHTWSLSVEEQFYLLFPLTLFLLFRWARSRVHLWLLGLIIMSFVLNLWATEHQPIVAFYWPFRVLGNFWSVRYWH